MNGTENGLTHLKARKLMLENQLGEIKNRITGRNCSFYPFITDKSGRVSERKLSHFIKELLDAPHKYDSHSIFFDFTNFPKLRELCECFLYCAVQGIADYDEYDKTVNRSAENFSDIVAIASHRNNIFFTNAEVLHRYEFNSAFYDERNGESVYYDEFNEGGFFRLSDVAYYLLTGQHIVQTFAHDEYKKFMTEYELERAKREGFTTVEAYPKSLEIEPAEIFDPDDYPEGTEFVDIDDDNEELAEYQCERNSEWVKSIVSPEKFVKKYLRFRELYFELGMFCRYHLFEEIELMVDVFLYEHGLSSFSEEDIFAMIYYRTDRLCNSLKHRK